MRLKAFTLAESLIVMFIISILALVMINNIKPGEVTQTALVESGKTMINSIDYATTNLLSKDSYNFSVTRLKDVDGNEFSINDSQADKKLLELYKKYLDFKRGGTLPSSYKSDILKDTENNKISGVSVSDFADGFFLRNGAYFTLKLNDNCTTSQTYIYNALTPTKRDATNSCGLIFIDVNNHKNPNTLGIDQFIISIGKKGIK